MNTRWNVPVYDAPVMNNRAMPGTGLARAASQCATRATMSKPSPARRNRQLRVAVFVAALQRAQPLHILRHADPRHALARDRARRHAPRPKPCRSTRAAARSPRRRWQPQRRSACARPAASYTAAPRALHRVPLRVVRVQVRAALHEQLFLDVIRSRQLLAHAGRAPHSRPFDHRQLFHWPPRSVLSRLARSLKPRPSQILSSSRLQSIERAAADS